MAKEIKNPNEEVDLYPVGSIFPLTDEETGEEVKFILRGKTEMEGKLYFAMVFADDEDAEEDAEHVVIDEDESIVEEITDDEVEERVKYFFQWCVDNDVRPGVELLALSLGTTRQTLWNWQKEGGRKGEIITLAKQMLAALIENWGQTGKINPAALCFIMKNNFGYSDNVQVELSQQDNKARVQSVEEIQARYSALNDGKVLELPKAYFLE